MKTNFIFKPHIAQIIKPIIIKFEISGEHTQSFMTIEKIINILKCYNYHNTFLKNEFKNCFQSKINDSNNQ